MTDLIAQRAETIDPGPDSNFSIWSAGGYIFGYDEIDITMEVEETAGSKRGRPSHGKRASSESWTGSQTM